MKKIREQKDSRQIEATLDLRESAVKYSGLEVSRSRLADAVMQEAYGTIVITEWVRPDWSSREILRQEFPEMRYVCYGDGPENK
jgi:hypothetical protein